MTDRMMQPIIGITNKGTEQAPRPFLEVHPGMGRALRCFRANEAGARECSDWLRAVVVPKLGGSTPAASTSRPNMGAPEIRFRELIEGAAGAEGSTDGGAP